MYLTRACLAIVPGKKKKDGTIPALAPSIRRFISGCLLATGSILFSLEEGWARRRMLASDWQHFVLEYSPCIVKETSLNPRAFRAWFYFCSGVRQLMDLPQCLKKAKLAEGLSLEYLTIGECLFGDKFCCISEHNLVQLARQTVTAGTAVCTSGLWLQRQMKVAKQSVRNRIMVQVDRTMFVRCRIDGALKCFKGLSQDKQPIHSASRVWFRDNKRVALQLKKNNSRATLLDLLDLSAKASNFKAALRDLYSQKGCFGTGRL